MNARRPSLPSACRGSGRGGRVRCGGASPLAGPRHAPDAASLCAVGLLLILAAPLLLVPSASAADPPAPQAELRYVRGLPIGDMVEVYEDDPTSACASQAPPPETPSRFARGEGEGWFRFREGDDENGCGEARFVIGVPAGATSLRVRFEANREVRSFAEQAALPVALAQRILLYDTGVQGPLDDHEYFPQDSGPITLFQDVEHEFSTLIPGRDRVTLSWLFHDKGVPQDNLGQNLGIVLGHEFAATVRGTELEFLGAEPASMQVDQAGRDLAGGQLLQRTRVRVEVPDDGDPELDVRLQISISNRYAVARAMGPGGAQIGSDQILVQEAQGVLQLILDESVTEQYGPGVYEVHFTSTSAVIRNPAMLAVFVLMVALPLLTGFFATRGVLGFSRRATTGPGGPGATLGPGASGGHRVGPGTDRYKRAARLLQVVLVGLWMAYGGFMLWVAFNRQLVDTMNAWPLQVAAAMYYLFLILLAVGFATLALLSGRHLLDWMENDIRERDQTQRELERSNRELEQFAYVASHDLQEPLRMVTHYTKLLEMRYKEELDQDARDFIGYATDGATRMKMLIDGLLTYSRVGRSNVKQESVDVDTVVKRALLNLRVKVQEAGAEVSIGHLPRVQGDPTMLTELFQNLIENGIKYRKEDGVPRIHVHAERDGNRGWRFTVQDNGIGIPQKHHKRVFQLFQRLHGRDAYSGTGLGLAICQRIVELHGGRIWVESTPGRGSSFNFTVPDRTIQPESATPSPARQRLTTQVPRGPEA